MAQPEQARLRRGRWQPQRLLDALEYRYARLAGRYETIEQDCEFVVGVAALIEAQDQVINKKNLIRRVMEAIEVVARDIDPDWAPERVTPLPPKRRDSASGMISKTAYNVMRKAKRPMTVREIARGALAAMGRRSTEQEVARFDIAIRAALMSKIGKDIILDPGPPYRFSIMPEEAWLARGAARRSASAANTPSNRGMSEPSRRRA